MATELQGEGFEGPQGSRCRVRRSGQRMCRLFLGGQPNGHQFVGTRADAVEVRCCIGQCVVDSDRRGEVDTRLSRFLLLLLVMMMLCAVQLMLMVVVVTVLYR